jgi:hypothetical protein
MRRILGSSLFCLSIAACGSSATQGSNDGEGDGATADGGHGTPAVCTSQAYWAGGDKGSELMHPGRVCITCHATEREAPKFSLAGTVYPTSHEPDECNGRSGSSGITIVVTDGTGKQLRPISVNEVGNFHFDGPVATPFHVKVVFNGKENAMSASPPNGDCNSCHTQNGANSAPGRILAP